jgi:hypothetical protein
MARVCPKLHKEEINVIFIAEYCHPTGKPDQPCKHDHLSFI